MFNVRGGEGGVLPSTSISILTASFDIRTYCWGTFLFASKVGFLERITASQTNMVLNRVVSFTLLLQ